MKTSRPSREEWLRLADEEAEVRAAYGRMMGAFERDEMPTDADADVIFRFMSAEDREHLRRTATACIQLHASEGRAEIIALAREYNIPIPIFRTTQ